MRKLRILLVDDHETVRAGLRVVLNAQADLEVVGEAADGPSALDRVGALTPDLVILDVSMPVLNGLETTERLASRFPGVRVIAFTRHADHGYVQQLLRAGARGYVLKQSPTAEVLWAIRAVAAGGTYLDSSVVNTVVTTQRGRASAAAHVSPQLSPREREIFKEIAWGRSNKEIAAQLGISVKTVETHKTNAMQKLSIRNRIEIVRYALLQGWLQDT